MKYTKRNNLDFLSSYWSMLNNISNDIIENLPKNNKSKPKKIGIMSIINYSDIKNSWSVNELIKGDYRGLSILAKKLSHMIIKGDSVNIKPMLSKIITGRKRTFKFKDKDMTVNCGKGHFRLGQTAIILTEEEILKIKEYFKL